MSILVEALTLVVPRHILDVSYPGGAEGWIEWLNSGESDPRWIIADDGLVGASFLTDDLPPAMEKLSGEGILILDTEAGAFVEAAVVDQERGPEWDCSWLVWERTAHEFYSHCWLLGRNPGELAIPQGWTPGQDELRRAPGLRPEDGIHLATEHGKEHWLDLQSGKLRIYPEELPGELPEEVEALRDTVVEWAESRGFEFRGPVEWSLNTTCSAGLFPAAPLRLDWSGGKALRAWLALPLRVPPSRQSELLERLARSEEADVIFEIDSQRGYLMNYIGIALEGGMGVGGLDQMLEILTEGALVGQRALFLEACHWTRPGVVEPE